MDALGAPLHVELQSCLRQFLFDGLDKTCDVGIAAFLSLIQPVLNIIVSIVLQVF